LTPLKDILRNYNELTVRGLDTDVMTSSLDNVLKAVRARGFKGRPMNDYSIDELDHSWRMQKLVDDLIFGL
jgi:hypothetical protein